MKQRQSNKTEKNNQIEDKPETAITNTYKQ